METTKHQILFALLAMNVLLLLLGGGSGWSWILETARMPANNYGATVIYPINQTFNNETGSCIRARDNIEICQDPYSCSEMICRSTLYVGENSSRAYMWVLVEPPFGGAFVDSVAERDTWCRYHSNPSFVIDHSKAAKCFLTASLLNIIIDLLLISQLANTLVQCRRTICILILFFTVSQVVLYAVALGLASMEIVHPVLKAWFPYMMAGYSLGCLIYLLVFTRVWMWNLWLSPPSQYQSILNFETDFDH